MSASNRRGGGGMPGSTKQQGRGGMGTHKHGTSGKSGPSPKTKFMTGFDANRLAAEIAGQRRKPRMWPSVAAALKAAIDAT